VCKIEVAVIDVFRYKLITVKANAHKIVEEMEGI
jgi:hypothetical protein